MDIPRLEIEETKKFIQEQESIKYVHYRDLYKHIDHLNFQICTKVDFKEIKPTHENVKESWGRLKHSFVGDIIFEYKSKSGSEYFITSNGNVYRFSDHWGAVSTCEWTLDGTGELYQSLMICGPLQMGVANLRDFVIFRRKHPRKVDILINPQWTAKIVEIVPLVVKLESIKFSPEFQDLPGPDKQLVGASHGQFVRILRQISK
jgi:hypothetical protein